MTKIIVITLLMGISACSRENVYNQPVPTTRAGLAKVKDSLNLEDRDAWGQIMTARMDPVAHAIDSKTVGQAIVRRKAKTACLAANWKFDQPDMSANTNPAVFNKAVDSYNTCLALPE